MLVAEKNPTTTDPLKQAHDKHIQLLEEKHQALFQILFNKTDEKAKSLAYYYKKKKWDTFKKGKELLSKAFQKMNKRVWQTYEKERLKAQKTRDKSALKRAIIMYEISMESLRAFIPNEIKALEEKILK